MAGWEDSKDKVSIFRLVMGVILYSLYIHVFVDWYTLECHFPLAKCILINCTSDRTGKSHQHNRLLPSSH